MFNLLYGLASPWWLKLYSRYYKQSMVAIVKVIVPPDRNIFP